MEESFRVLVNDCALGTLLYHRLRRSITCNALSMLGRNARRKQRVTLKVSGKMSVTVATIDACGCHGNITVRDCPLQCLRRSQKVGVQKQQPLVTFIVMVRVKVRV